MRTHSSSSQRPSNPRSSRSGATDRCVRFEWATRAEASSRAEFSPVQSSPVEPCCQRLLCTAFRRETRGARRDQRGGHLASRCNTPLSVHYFSSRLSSGPVHIRMPVCAACAPLCSSLQTARVSHFAVFTVHTETARQFALHLASSTPSGMFAQIDSTHSYCAACTVLYSSSRITYYY